MEKEPRFWIGTHEGMHDHELVVTTGEPNKDGEWPVLFHSDYYPGLTEAFITSGIINTRSDNSDGTGLMFGEDSEIVRRIQEEDS